MHKHMHTYIYIYIDMRVSWIALLALRFAAGEGWPVSRFLGVLPFLGVAFFFASAGDGNSCFLTRFFGVTVPSFFALALAGFLGCGSSVFASLGGSVFSSIVSSIFGSSIFSSISAGVASGRMS